VNIAVGILIRTVARASFVVRRDGEELTSGPLYELFRRPNERTSRFDLWKEIAAWLVCTEENCYAQRARKIAKQNCVCPQVRQGLKRKSRRKRMGAFEELKRKARFFCTAKKGAQKNKLDASSRASENRTDNQAGGSRGD
jgi:hypothetical protein